MYSVNSVTLVSSFQHLVQQGFNTNQPMQDTQPRPLRKVPSPVQLSHSTFQSPINGSTVNTPLFAQCENQSKKYKLRSESLAIDFNQYKTNHSTKYTCCSFCKNNGEPEQVYMSHPFKDSKGTVICPILKNYQCPMCGESGEKAHTLTYCKEYKNFKRNKILSNMN